MKEDVSEFSNEIHEKIKELCALGDHFLELQDYRNAVINYRTAWETIPEPKENWNASTWVLGAIGDVYVQAGDFDYAVENLEFAMYCPGGLGNPFLHLRLGQAYYELGDFEKAADQLTRAYMAGGEKVFESEDEKYFLFLKEKIKL